MTREQFEHAIRNLTEQHRQFKDEPGNSMIRLGRIRLFPRPIKSSGPSPFPKAIGTIFPTSY